MVSRSRTFGQGCLCKIFLQFSVLVQCLSAIRVGDNGIKCEKIHIYYFSVIIQNNNIFWETMHILVLSDIMIFFLEV